MYRYPKWFLPLRFFDYNFVFVTHLLIDYIMNASSAGPFCYREERASGRKKEFHLFFVPRKSLLCEKWLKVGYISQCCNWVGNISWIAWILPTVWNRWRLSTLVGPQILLILCSFFSPRFPLKWSWRSCFSGSIHGLYYLFVRIFSLKEWWIEIDIY